MTALPEFPPVLPPDEDVLVQARSARDALPAEFAVPRRSLGRLESLGAWLSACQGQVPPRPLHEVRLIVVAGEHGVAQRAPEVSALPASFTEDAMRAIVDGRAPLISAASAAGIFVSLVDANSQRPSGAIDVEDAMTAAELSEHLRRGMSIADAEADKGTQLLLLGDVGRGLTTVAAAVIGSICGIEPVKIVGRGSGIDDSAWRVKTAAIRDAMYRVRDDRADASRVLRRIGSPDLAVLTGILAQSAIRRTPVVIDGLGVAAAALCAQLLVPGAAAWWVAGSVGEEPAHMPALKALRLDPLINVGIGTGQGLGAIMALPLLRQAVDTLAADPLAADDLAAASSQSAE